MKKTTIKNRGHVLIPSEFEEGKTILNDEQNMILKEISRVLNHGKDDYYVSTVLCYAPSGLIGIIEAEIKTKLKSGTIDSAEAIKAYELLESLTDLLSYS